MVDPATEWGLPDWRDAKSYPTITQENRNRWRWEFLRRRKDLREDFDRRAAAAFEAKMETFDRHPELYPNGCPRGIDEPGFYVSTKLIKSPLHLEKLPNPRISDQPYWAISWTHWDDGWTRFAGDDPPEGFLRFDFDLPKPIEPQIKMARETLREFQIINCGRLIQNRRHTDKWLTYLRVLDARECGASWSEIATILPMTAGTEQTARDTWEQARALCFNF